MLLSAELLWSLERLLDEEAQGGCQFSGLVRHLLGSSKIRTLARFETNTFVQAGQGIPASEWTAERLRMELSQITWESASRMVKQFVPLSTDVNGSGGYADFSKLCLNLGLQVSSHGRTLFVKMMNSIEKDINPREIDPGENLASAQAVAKKQGSLSVNMFTTTAQNQAVAFHLLECAFSIHDSGDESRAIACAARLIEALWQHSAMKKKRFAESEDTKYSLASLLDILNSEETRVPFPLLGKIMLKLLGVNAGRFVSSENVIYVMSWIQLRKGKLSDAADKVLSTMMLMFMLTRSPDIFSGVGEEFRQACLDAVKSDGVLPERVMSAQASLLSGWMPDVDTSDVISELAIALRDGLSDFKRQSPGLASMLHDEKRNFTVCLNGAFGVAVLSGIFGIYMFLAAVLYVVTIGKVNMVNPRDTLW